MRILHLLPSNKFSGAENVICQIFDIMADEKDLDMIYCSPIGKIKASLEQRNVPYFPLKKFRLGAIKKAIKLYKPDIIHAHDVLAAFAAARVCKDIPVISHMHGNNILMRKRSYLSYVYKSAHKKLKHIFWVSKSALNDYIFSKAIIQKSSVLYNIVNPETIYTNMAKDTSTYDYDVCYVGRLSYPKHPQRLMKVLRLAIDMNPQLRVCVVGTGELEEETLALAKELNLGDNVDFLGFVSNPLKIINDSKVMVMTSRYEGTPMCALEAIALGKPIVSTPVDGLIDIIDNDKNGYLSNDDTVLAEKLISIATDDDTYNRLSENVLQKSKEINDKEKYKQAILSAYNSCLKP